MIVCLCNGVTERDIQRELSQGCCSLEDLAMRTGCGTTCGCCRDVARSLVEGDAAVPAGLAVLPVAA